MSLVTPILICNTRRKKRRTYNEYKDKILVLHKNIQHIEDSFLKALFTHETASYRDIYYFYQVQFDRLTEGINEKLTFNHVDTKYFENNFKPIEK